MKNTKFYICPHCRNITEMVYDTDIALYCCGAYRAMNAAALNFYQTVMRDGTQKAAVETMQSRDDLYKYLGYHAYEDKLDALFAAQK